MFMPNFLPKYYVENFLIKKKSYQLSLYIQIYLKLRFPSSVITFILCYFLSNGPTKFDKKWHKWVYETFGSNGLRLVEILTRFSFLSKNSVYFPQTLQKENYWGPLTKNNDTTHCFNPLTPKIWLLILLSSYYTFPCKLVMGTWCEIKIAASTYTW